MRSRLVKFAAVLAVLSLAMSACGDDDDTTTPADPPSENGSGNNGTGGGGENGGGEGCDDSKDAIKIGNVTTAQNYVGMEDAIVARIERENETCVNGHKLEFVGSRDDAGDVQKNLDGARDLVENNDADLLLITSDRNVQTAPYLAQQKVPFFGWSFMPSFCGDDAWGMSVNGCLSGWAFDHQGIVDLDDPPLSKGFIEGHQVISGKDDYKLVVFQEDTEAGRAGGALYDEMFGDRLLANEYLPQRADGSVEPAVLTDAVQLVRDQNPDVVFLSTTFAMAVSLSTAIKASDYQGAIQNMVAYSPGLLESSDDLAAAFEGTYTFVQYPTVEEGGADQIAADLKAAGKAEFVTLGGMIGWWNLDLAIEMMKQVDGDITGEAIRQVAVDGFTYDSDGGPTVNYPADFARPSGGPCRSIVKVEDKTYQVVEKYTCFELD